MRWLLSNELKNNSAQSETGKQWRCEDMLKDRPPNTTLLLWMT